MLFVMMLFVMMLFVMMLFVMILCGCSSAVERHVANVNVVGSTPITRLFFTRIQPTSHQGCL